MSSYRYFCAQIKKLAAPAGITLILFLTIFFVIALVAIISLAVYYFKFYKPRRMQKLSDLSKKRSVQMVDAKGGNQQKTQIEDDDDIPTFKSVKIDDVPAPVSADLMTYRGAPSSMCDDSVQMVDAKGEDDNID